MERIVSPDAKRASRIPPGQYGTKRFPVLDLGVVPEWNAETWRLKIWGEVEHPLDIGLEGFGALPHVALHADFHCVTKWSRLGLDWEGVHVRTLLEKVKPHAVATHVTAHSLEGYTTNVPLAALDDEDVILADTLDGKPLPAEHGAPVRLLVPKLYAWKSAKFLTGLEFHAGDRPGFWEQRGYHNEGDPWKEERFW